jgi:hypothetical protein
MDRETRALLERERETMDGTFGLSREAWTYIRDGRSEEVGGG